MDEETHKKLVMQIGEAFKALPSDRARIDVLASLTSIMEKRFTGPRCIEQDWMMQASASLRGVWRLMKE